MSLSVSVSGLRASSVVPVRRAGKRLRIAEYAAAFAVVKALWSRAFHAARRRLVHRDSSIPSRLNQRRDGRKYQYCFAVGTKPSLLASTDSEMP
jgi:hypothetical protein